MTRAALAIAALAACHGESSPAGPALASVWDLEVVVPAGWTRENIVIRKFEGIRVASPAGVVDVYFAKDDEVQPTANAYFRWKNHAAWNDEVTSKILDERTYDDGWLARFELQTRVRPTPDALIFAQRELGGRHVDCVADQPKPEAFADAMMICERLHFDPAHGSAASLPRPPPDWDESELQVDLPAGWKRSIDHDMLELEGPAPAHVHVSAYRQTSRDVPTMAAFLRDENIADADIVAKQQLADGVVVTYRVGKSIYVRGSRTIATRNFRCSAIVDDAATAEQAASLCAAMHR